MNEAKNRSNVGFRILRSLCCLATIVFLSSCGSPIETPLRIGSNTWLGYEPLYLARSLGYYENSQVNLIELTSASEVMSALSSGALDGAALTLDEVLTLLDDGLDLKVILVIDFSNGGDVLLAKPGIGTLADLRGKRIAVEYTAVGALLLDAALKQGGLDVADVEIVSAEVDKHLNVYPSVDAVVTFEPVRTELLKQGAIQLFDSSSIPGRIVDVLVVLGEKTKIHPRSLEQLLAGYFKAREYLETQPDKAANRMTERLGLSPAEIMAAYDGLSLPDLEENRKLLNSNAALLEGVAGDLAGFMFEKKMLRKRLTTKGLTSDRFLPEDKP